MAKAMVFMVLLISLLFFIQNIDASDEFVVGGWGVWSLESTTCNQWKERSRLQLGETIGLDQWSRCCHASSNKPKNSLFNRMFSMAKAMVFMGLLSLLLLIQNIDASRDKFVVGGWGIWSLESSSCNQWNEKTRLQLGDTIVYMYEADKSLMVKVNQEDCIICNTPSSVNATKYNDGYSVVKLNQTGPNYSISGMVENNDKISILVMADLTRSTPTAPSLPTQAPTCECNAFLYIFWGFLLCIALLLVVGGCAAACAPENEIKKGGIDGLKIKSAY
ncbi:early nodulin-like protein 9 [Artemisia annua]|uniref:Early nodulin-like protein 9 n=1 Tax=Artemisia annua TaxID=35608 RepID=A0A2U1QEB8_ARTAN|nr:early nodulin-like protein 9 [Artemisia annua]